MSTDEPGCSAVFKSFLANYLMNAGINLWLLSFVFRCVCWKVMRFWPIRSWEAEAGSSRSAYEMIFIPVDGFLLQSDYLCSRLSWSGCRSGLSLIGYLLAFLVSCLCLVTIKGRDVVASSCWTRRSVRRNLRGRRRLTRCWQDETKNQSRVLFFCEFHGVAQYK